jgi:hypothetical protein
MEKEKHQELLKDRFSKAYENNVISYHYILGHVADVMYGLFFELERGLDKHGLKLKHEEKYEFKRMMESVQMSQKLLLRYTQGFFKDDVDDFCDRADDLSMVFKAFCSKWFASEENQDKIVNYLSQLNGTPMFRQDVINLEKLIQKEKENENNAE